MFFFFLSFLSPVSRLSVRPARLPHLPTRCHAAYVCDELKAAALVGEDAEPEESTADGEPAAKYACPEQEPGRACPSYQNSPAAESCVYLYSTMSAAYQLS